MRKRLLQYESTVYEPVLCEPPLCGPPSCEPPQHDSLRVGRETGKSAEAESTTGDSAQEPSAAAEVADRAAPPDPAVAREIWLMKLRGREEVLRMVNPQLREDQLAEVSGQLSEIINQEG